MTLNTDNIPQELKELRQWVLWRNKIPYQPNGLNAESNNRETWSTFDEVMAALPSYDGIGIMFADGLCGIDIDHCRENDDFTPLARRVVKTINSYTEVSPSKTGLHILFWGVLPPGRRKHTESGLEMYDDRRYFTVTGNHLAGTPAKIEERIEEVKSLHKEVFGEVEEKSQSVKAAPGITPLEDNQLLDLALSSKNGDKFARLFGGHLDEHDSQSEADLALVSILAFWSGGDRGRIDRLFRTSGLMREKWDEKRGVKTYGEITIDTALSGISEFYQPGIEPQFSDEPRKLSSYADLKKVIGPITWSWKSWLANALMLVIAAESGMGKSALMMWLARTYINRDPWPDGTPYTGKTGLVLWCESESAQALNLERAEKWGIPLDKLVFPMGDPMADFRLTNEHHKYALAEIAQRPEVVAIMIDSLSGADNRVERGTEDSGVIFWLASLARDSGKDLLISHHLRKRGLFDGDNVTLDRVRGSSAIIQPARLVWALDTPDHQRKENMRLQVIKSNLAKFPQPLGMSINDNGFTFGAAPTAPRNETAVDKASDLLLSLLESGEPVKVLELQDEFSGAAISWRAAERAKEKLHIISEKRGENWYWKKHTGERE